MGPSLSFLFGLATLLSYEQFVETLPGGESLATLLWFAILLPAPFLTARIAAKYVMHVVLRGGAPGSAARFLLVLSAWLVPLIYAALVLGGDLPRFAESWTPRSYTLQFIILMAPLTAMELSVRLATRRVVRLLEMTGVGAPAMLGANRVRMTAFVLVAILLLVAGVDLLFLDRRLELFFSATSLGASLGFIIVIVAFSVLLPLLFRVVMRASRELPEHRAEDIMRTAAQLQFPPRAVLSMRTGHRLVNAALVGPLPWPRYLVLTDGLLSLLDSLALRGVVAHEVGHARARHPGLLLLVYAVLPILAIHPLWTFVVAGQDHTVLAILAAIAVAVAFVSMRLLAHRFEYEADQFAAEALGGAESCVQALRRVGELAPLSAHRGSFRHPSEERRIRNMLSCESDPEYRARFWRRGRTLRVAIAVVVVGVLAAAAWAQAVVWPLDRAIYLAYTGNFSGAEVELAALDPTSRVDHEFVGRLRAEIDTGKRLVEDGADPQKNGGDLAARAWREGRSVLGRDGPVAARPWFALSLLDPEPDAVRRSLYLYCAAAADQDEARMQRIREHLFELGVDGEVAQALSAGR